MKYAIFLAVALTTPFAFANEPVLFIGDSHSVMSFGHTLAQQLGPSVKRYAVSSSTALDWLKPRICPIGKPCDFVYGYSTPDGDFEGPVPATFAGVDLLLKRTSAQQIIVALGTNDANQRCLLPLRTQMLPIKSLLKRIGKRACFWVGPPAYKRGPVYDHCGEGYDNFVSRMKNVVQAHGCKFIDSRKILDPQTQQPIAADFEDLVHFDTRLGRIWAEAAARQFYP